MLNTPSVSVKGNLTGICPTCALTEGPIGGSRVQVHLYSA